jgi:hypothetical protein
MTPSESDDLHLHYQSLDGSLNWLAHTTHPDISTVVSLLVLNLSSYGHFEAACYVVKYLSNTKKLGIYFTSTKRSIRSVSKQCTSKGLQHTQIKENGIWENLASNFISVHHINGNLNIANIFTKELKDTTHFVALRNLFMCPCFPT